MVDFKLLFRARGYSNTFVNKALAKVAFINPGDRVNMVRVGEEGRKFFFKTVFDDRKPMIRPLLVANWDDLNGELNCSRVFGLAKAVMCYRNGKNLKNLVSRSALRIDVKMNPIVMGKP